MAKGLSSTLLLASLLLLFMSSFALAARNVQKLSTPTSTSSNNVDATRKDPTNGGGDGLSDNKNFLTYGGVGGAAGIGGASGIVGPFGGIGSYGGIGGGAGIGSVGGVFPVGGVVGGLGGVLPSP